MKIKFDTETIRLITLFENVTGASVRDCLIDEKNKMVYFVIEEGDMGIAIGKNGSSVKNVEKIIGKSVKLFEFSKDIVKFIKAAVHGVTDIKIRNESEKVIVEIKVGKGNRALAIGRSGKNIKIVKDLIQRNYGINNLVVR